MVTAFKSESKLKRKCMELAVCKKFNSNGKTTTILQVNEPQAFRAPQFRSVSGNTKKRRDSALKKKDYTGTSQTPKQVKTDKDIQELSLPKKRRQSSG